MWKHILIAFLPQLIELAFDYFIIAARSLAAKTETTIDDDMVNKLEQYRADLIDTAKREMKR